VAKSWYNFFLVTDDQGGQAAPPAPDSPDPGLADSSVNQGRRAAELVPAGDTDTSLTGVATNLTALADVYSAAQIAAPAHGYTVLKVADMLRSEHIQTLPSDVKRKSILVALEAAGVAVDEIVQDALRRDRALDTYERVLQKSLEEIRTEKQAENARLEQEIDERLAELRGRIEQNNQGVARELDNLRAWQLRKQEEERRIAEAVGYFVSENPISTSATTATTAEAKGDVNAR
jgi:hypothetical protein